MYVEDDGEEGGDEEVGDPIEGLPNRGERILGVDGHDLGNKEALDVPDSDSERDDDQHHRHNLSRVKREWEDGARDG